jgi:succinoglycan biosynthesis protein ExoM
MALNAIAICTYRRPIGLRSALSSLVRQRLDGQDAAKSIVVVVDNSPDGSALTVCGEFGTKLNVRYVHEPRKGLSNARNAALEEGIRCGAERIAFMDDDELATENWISELSRCMDGAGTIIAAGPTYPLFAAPPETWVPIEAYSYVAKASNGFARDASSANMMIDLSRLEKLGMQFDAEFNEAGGEDTQLIARLLAAGEKIAWADNAIVWDQIPRDRIRPGWLFRRWYRTGITEARVLTPEHTSAHGRLSNIAKGLLRVGYGTVRIASGALRYIGGSPGRLVASCYTMFRGLGYLAAAFGHSFKEYASQRYR